MINLLPPELKQDYRYARRNRRLVRWSLAFLTAITGVAVLTVGGLVIMNRSTDTYQADIAKIKTQMERQDLAGTQREITAISNNLKLMVNVLSSEVLFSKLLVHMGSITPQKVILTSLSMSQDGGAIDITARAVNNTDAAQLQANLVDIDNELFSRADIVDINCSSGEKKGIAAQYPCVVTIKALFVKDNPFLFINTDKDKKT